MNHQNTIIWTRLILCAGLAIGSLGAHAETFELRMGVEAVPGARDIERGDIDKGISRLHQALKQSKSYPQGAIATDLCAAYTLQRDFVSAEQWCDRAVSESPNDGAAHNNRGVLRVVQGDYESAIEDFRQAIQLRNYKVGAHGHTELINQGYRHASKQIADRNLAIAEQRWAAAQQVTEQQRLANK